MPYMLRPPIRSTILSTIIRKLALLFRLNDLDPGFDDELARRLLQGIKAVRVPVDQVTVTDRDGSRLDRGRVRRAGRCDRGV